MISFIVDGLFMIESSNFSLPPSQPISKRAEVSKTEKDKDLSQSIIHKSSEKSHSSKKSTAARLDHDTLQENITEGLKEIQEIQKGVSDIEERFVKVNNIESVLNFVDTWIVEFILTGTTLHTEILIPLLTKDRKGISIDDKLFHAALAHIEFAADLLELLSGTAGTLYKDRVLRAAKKKIAEISQQKLDPQQFARLQRVKEHVKFEESTLAAQFTKLRLKMAKNVFKFVKFIVEPLTHPVVSAISSSIGTLVGGITLVLNGLAMLAARKKLILHSEWKKELGYSIKNDQILPIIRENLPEHAKMLSLEVRILLEKRYKRREEQISSLEKQISSGTLSIDTIRQKIKEIKTANLETLIEKISSNEISQARLQEILENKLGFPVSQELIQTIHRDIGLILHAKDSEGLPILEKHATISTVQQAIHTCIEESMQEWLSQQTIPFILSTYVDYHAVLDLTVKNSMNQMLQNKHAIEEKFLNLKKKITTGSLIFSSASFATALTLGIIGLVTTPLGGAGLILLAMSIGTLSLSWGFAGVAYYHSYQDKPGATLAILKGMHLKLFAIYTKARLHTIKEKIATYFHHAWQEKRSRISADTGQVTIFPAHYSTKKSKRRVEATQRIMIRQQIEQSAQILEKKSEYLKKKARELEEELADIHWQDFAQAADLQVRKKPDDFDTLDALSHSIDACDLQLLSPETRELIEKQMGINITSLKTDTNQPQFKQLLKDFFSLNDEEIVEFIEKQKIKKEITTNHL